jgi:hypothetical protein
MIELLEKVRCVDCDWRGRAAELVIRGIEEACPQCDSVAGVVDEPAEPGE